MYSHPLSINSLCENPVAVRVEIVLSKIFTGVHPCTALLAAICGMSSLEKGVGMKMDHQRGYNYLDHMR